MADETTPPTDEPEVEVAATSSDPPHVEALAVVGTGTPATSPNFGVPRFSGNDPADFPTQGNAITDTFDAAAAKRGAIVDADIAAGASIAKAKLAPLSIVDADVAAAAAIAEAKLNLATDAAPAVGSRRTLGRGANQAMPGSSAPAGFAAATAARVLDVGVLGQLRAGRQLAAADFTALGLSAPVGLWNLSDLSDASGNGRALSNKGAVPFGPGINGAAATAAVFAGSTGQALYIADTGAADPFRIPTGSWGCWFRTAKLATSQVLLSKASATQSSFGLYVHSSNSAGSWISLTGGDAPQVIGVTSVADDRWHFAVVTYDALTLSLYIDGVLEGTATMGGALFGVAGPLDIGGQAGDAATATTSPHYGRADEAFVTADVLSPEQVRCLYCAKLAHGFTTTPTAVSVAVRRLRKGAPFVPADFPTAPLRLHNFTAGSLADQGSGNVPLVNNGAAVPVAGADGALQGAYNLVTASSQSLSATDAGLPSGAALRSYGCWFKTVTGEAGTVMAFGGISMWVTGGTLVSSDGGTNITSPWVAHGLWHLVVLVEDSAPGDGLKRKMYLDGRLVGATTVLGSPALAGANGFRVGSYVGGSNYFTGQVDGVFICGYVLTQDVISALYAKGSQALAPSPKNAGDHIEYADAANVYGVFDALDSQYQIDLAVMG